MLKVMLVDDEPFIVQGLSALIPWETLGCQIVKTAPDGKEALEYLYEHQVDLILADIQMPVMSGLELLKKLREENISDAWFVVLSGYSDFKYAQQAMRYDCIEYILKPVQREELEEVIRKVEKLHESREEKKDRGREAESVLINRNLITLLKDSGDLRNVEYVAEHMHLSGCLRYIALVPKKQEAPLTQEENVRWQRELSDVCRRKLGQEREFHFLYDITDENHRVGGGIIFCDSMAVEQGMSEKKYLLSLLTEINQELGIPAVMLAGCRTEKLQELSKSYRTAMMLCSFLAFWEPQEIFWYEEEIQKKESGGKVLCKEDLDKLISVIEQNDSVGIRDCVDELYRKIGELGMDSNTVSINVNYLLFGLVHLAVQQDERINQEEVLQAIRENGFDKNGVFNSQEYLIRFAVKYAEYLAQLRQKTSRGVLAKVEQNIHTYYMTNLTLKELSGKYFVNSAYLGQMFRKKYGVSFKEYLNNYRMEKAVELLLHTDKKIYEIAEEVGYHDLDYFINRFIAIKGCTPSRFRKQAGNTSKKENI